MRRMTRALATLAFAALAVAAWAPFAHAQAGESRADDAVARMPRFLLASALRGSPPSPVDIDRSPTLSRRIAVDLDGALIGDALDAISTNGGFRIAYSPDVVARDIRVHLRAQNITVAAALMDVLAGTGVDMIFTPEGGAALVRRPPPPPADGVVRGIVVDAIGGVPIEAANVAILGTRLSATTDASGRYVIRSVPAGERVVRFARIGFASQTRTVQVGDGADVVVDFTGTRTAVALLPDVVTTATGQQRRVEIGNAITTITNVSKKVEESAVRNLADLMVAKAAGVVVLPGNETGSSPVVRIRGTNSLSLSNAPIYVIDGVRMISASVGVATGGTSTSFLNDLNPGDIEDIEIVKGPSAATLYGTDAANGVIVITTKRGLAGATRWSYYGEGGAVRDRGNYVSQYAIFGHAPGSTAPTRCILLTIALKQCVADSTTAWNPMLDPEVSPISPGHRDQLGLNVSGGTEAVRFYVSGDHENEIGAIKMPAFARAWLDSIGNPARDEQIYPEAFQRQSVRANLNAALSSRLDISINTGYTNRNQRLPQTDNSPTSVVGTMLKNPGFKPVFSICKANVAACLGYTDIGSLGEEMHGYGNFMPAQTFQSELQQGVQRFTGSVDANWRPFAWMQNQGSLGIDLAGRQDWTLCRLNECANSGTLRQGSVSDQRSNNRNFSAKLISSASWQAKPWAILKATVGADYNNIENDFVASSATGLPPGAQNVGQGAVKNGSNQLQTANKTLGVYVQEQASIHDRLFLTAAIRSDQNSAFGTQFQRVFYPKVQASWLISEQGFFPKYAWLDQLRLRSAYGASGVQPGATTALQTFSAVTRTVNAIVPGNATGTDTPALVQSALGNPDLKPESSKEFEAGFESRMFASRATVDFTFYHKQTSDALISQPIAPSAAPPATSVTRNLGSVMNEGFEALVSLTLVDRKSVGWTMTLNGSHTSNKILSLGVDANGNPNPTIGTGTTRDSVGLAANTWFFIPYTFEDKNKDGLIETSEVSVGTKAVPMGYSQPRDIFSVQNSVDLFNHHLRLSALVDYKGGSSVMNTTFQIYCTNQPTCYEETVADAPLWRQARNIAQRYTSTTTVAGFLENSQFWRLREVSATLDLPGTIAQRLRARDGSIAFRARNLHLWTSYTGADPEGNYSTGDVQSDFQTIAPPTYLTVRVNLHY
jgi:TonB-linked SusC/RagA family outer membrane protein